MDIEKARANSKIESVYVATLVGLYKARHRREAAARDAGSLVMAATLPNTERLAGRPQNFAKLSLFRSLGAIYEDGTGKRPSITGATTRRPRGKAYRFVCDVCNVLGVPITPRFLSEFGYRRRRNKI
jgi:hypothetical protein